MQPLAGLSVAVGTHQATEMEALRATGDVGEGGADLAECGNRTYIHAPTPVVSYGRSGFTSETSPLNPKPKICIFAAVLKLENG